MKVGDLVEAMRPKDLLIQRGIILSQIKKPTPDNWLSIYEVMTTDGRIDKYTSSSLRIVK